MKIKKVNKDKLLFRIKYSNFIYQMIFFKLFNIFINLQKNINKILIKKHNIFVIIYLNNIIIYIKDTK